MRTHLSLKDATDPFRERLLELGIESLLESDFDDSPEHSSSEAPTTGNSNRSHDSYWSAAQSMDSSITSQSSLEQPTSNGGPLSMVTNLFSRSRSPSRPSSRTTPQETKGSNIPWKPAKPPIVREPSPPLRTAPQPINSAKDQERDESQERSRLKTGRFPWSPSSSPDSVGSPILAVVNQFLQPDTSHTSENVFKNDYSRPSLADRFSREQIPTAPQYPAASKAATPAAMPAKNRRNTVNATPPPPVPAPSKAAPEASRRGRDGWGAIDSPYGEPAAPAEYSFFGGGNTRNGAAYGAQNKSSNALPMFSNSNNYGWDAQADNEQAPQGYFDMPHYDADEMEDSSWMPEEALQYMGQPPAPAPAPPRTVAPRPTEKKEQVQEKKTKTSKSPFASLSKKSAPSEPVTSLGTSTASTLRSGLTAKSLFAAASANRKSTIAVEDATPFNTPPKTTVNLPSPTTTSPVTAKPKKTKSKKGSISETPKEKEVAPMKVDDLSMPSIQDDGSASRVKRRGSGASVTSRPASPMAMFLGSRGATTANKKEAPSKPSAAKPSSFKSSAFGWGAKPKSPSPAPAPVESDWNTDNFSYGASAFASTGWKSKGDEATSMAIVRSPATTPNEGAYSDYDMASEPVSTPPTKSGWKTKSYFPWDGKPSASSPKEEEEDLAQLMAQMTYSEATPKAPVAFDFSEGASAFQFNSSSMDKEGDDFWSGKFSKAAKNTAARPEPPKVVEEFSPVVPKSRTTKSKADPIPEPTPFETKASAVKGKNKKGTAKMVANPTIAMESLQPTPTSEADEWTFNPPTSAPKVAKPETKAKNSNSWSFGAAAESNVTNSRSFGFGAAAALPQKTSRFDTAPAKVEPVKQKSGEAYDDWFGAGKDVEDEEQQEVDEEAAAQVEETPQYDDWFSAAPKPKATSKASKVVEVTPTVASKVVKGKKGTKVESVPKPVPAPVPVPESFVVETPEEAAPNVEDTTEDADADNWWSAAPTAKAGAKAGAKAKPVTKSAWGAPSKAKPAPEPVEDVKVPEEPDSKQEDDKEDADDWWSAPTKGKKNAKASEPAKASPPAAPAANKWSSITFDSEEPKPTEDDLTAELVAALGSEEAVKPEESTKTPEAETVATPEKEEEKPAAKTTVKGAAKKKKGKR